jgi:L-cysteine S-thiosulfotransferase
MRRLRDGTAGTKRIRAGLRRRLRRRCGARVRIDRHALPHRPFAPILGGGLPGEAAMVIDLAPRRAGRELLSMKVLRGVAGSLIGSAAALLSAPSPPALAEAPGLPSLAVVTAGGVATLPAALTDKPGDVKEGAKVVAGRRLGNCLSCHEISVLSEEEFHGNVGPPLDGVAARWGIAALRMIIVNAKMVFGGETVMPAFYRTDGLNRVRPEFAGKPILTAQQVEDVVAFLATLK